MSDHTSPSPGAAATPIGSDSPVNPSNSDKDLAELAARFRGMSPGQVNLTPKRNSDAELRKLAAAIGASPNTAQGEGSKGNLQALAKQLMNPNTNAKPTDSKHITSVVAGTVGGVVEEGRQDVPATEANVAVDSQTDGKHSTEGAEISIEEEEEGDHDQADEDVGHDWVQFVDEESMCPYWYNQQTGETTWEEPEEDFGIDQSAAHLLDPHRDSADNKTADVVEGFICPVCMVDTGSQQNLVNHSKTGSCSGKARKPNQREISVPKPPNQKPQSMTERIYNLFGGTKSEDVGGEGKGMGEDDGSHKINLTEKQVKKLLGLHKKNKVLRSKLAKQTEKYTKNIQQLVERDRKYKILLKRQDEQHKKDLLQLREQNARLAKGIAVQHEEFKRKSIKLLKQNQTIAKELSQAMISQQDKRKLETDNKALRQENQKLKQYIHKLQRELVEQKTIIGALKDTKKALGGKIVELESKFQMSEKSQGELESMPVATLPVKREPKTASV